MLHDGEANSFVLGRAMAHLSQRAVPRQELPAQGESRTFKRNNEAKYRAPLLIGRLRFLYWALRITLV